MNLLDSKATSDKLVELLDEHSSVSFAVAWATLSPNFFKELQNNKSKIQKSVIGTHGYSTDPRVLDWCLDEKPFIGFIFDRTKNKRNPIFHPKIYVFKSPRKWDVLIGSANLTEGGLKNNTELVLHVGSDEFPSSSLLQNSLKVIDEYWKLSTKRDITRTQVAAYRRKHEKEKQKQYRVETLIPELKIPELLSWEWSEFYDKVKRDEFYKHRLALLSQARKIFQSHKNFIDIDPENRKVLAGTVTKPKHDDWRNINVSCFGPTGSSIFAGLIDRENVHVFRAIDCIPISRKVTRSDFMNYVDEIKKGFGDNQHGLGHVARLLAIKRPDTFVPFNGPVKPGIHEDLDLKPRMKGTHYERYWDEVLAKIKQAKWYKSQQPKNETERNVWRFRVAMLDAVYYPKN